MMPTLLRCAQLQGPVRYTGNISRKAVGTPIQPSPSQASSPLCSVAFDFQNMALLTQLKADQTKYRASLLVSLCWPPHFLTYST